MCMCVSVCIYIMYIGIPVWTEKPGTPRTQFFYSFQRANHTYTHREKVQGSSHCKTIDRTPRCSVANAQCCESIAPFTKFVRSSMHHHTSYTIHHICTSCRYDRRRTKYHLDAKLRTIICFRSLKHRYKYWLNHRAALSWWDFVRRFEISKEQPTSSRTDR